MRMLAYETGIDYEVINVWIFLIIMPGIIFLQFCIIFYMNRNDKRPDNKVPVSTRE